MGLYSGRLVIGRIFACEIWGAYIFFFGGGGGGRLSSEFYGMGREFVDFGFNKGCLLNEIQL